MEDEKRIQNYINSWKSIIIEHNHMPAYFTMCIAGERFFGEDNFNTILNNENNKDLDDWTYYYLHDYDGDE